MNILLIKVSSLGDVLHNMPIVSDILHHDPHAQIDWVVEEAYVDLVKLQPGVRTIIPFALRRWRKQLFSSTTRAEIRAFRQQLQAVIYDRVLDTQGLMKTGLIMGMSRIAANGKKVGLANGTEDSGYEGLSRMFHSESVTVDVHCHAVLRCRLVAAQACGYTIDRPAHFGLLAPALQPNWLPNSPYAVFFHGTARDEKKWKQDNWISVAQHLAQHHLAILLPWGNPTEKAEAEALAAAIPEATVLPRLNMMEAVLLAQRASLVIGVDTGLTHIAAAYERPTIELYCDSPRWKTEGNWSDQIINLGDTGCPPEVTEVIAAVDRLLKG